MTTGPSVLDDLAHSIPYACMASATRTPSEIESQEIGAVLKAPGALGYEYTAADNPGRYYGDFFLWRDHEEFRAFMAESPLPEIAARVMGARRGGTSCFTTPSPCTTPPATLRDGDPIRGGLFPEVWPHDQSDNAKV